MKDTRAMFKRLYDLMRETFLAEYPLRTAIEGSTDKTLASDERFEAMFPTYKWYDLVLDGMGKLPMDTEVMFKRFYDLIQETLWGEYYFRGAIEGSTDETLASDERVKARFPHTKWYDLFLDGIGKSAEEFRDWVSISETTRSPMDNEQLQFKLHSLFQTQDEEL